MMKTILPSSVGLEAVTPPVLNDTAPSNPNASLRAPASTVNINDLKVPAKELVTEIEETAAQFDLDATHIQSSPYADPLNHLDLGGLDQSLRLFAFALTQFQAKRPDYATADYMSTFNFSEIFSTLRDQCAQAGIEWKRQDFYVVIFRSKLRLEADRARLGELDQMSHQEACASGGLLQYWFGSPDSERRNLATCEFQVMQYEGRARPLTSLL